MIDYCGNIRGARKKAEQYATEHHVREVDRMYDLFASTGGIVLLWL